jgi:hypothetical protein
MKLNKAAYSLPGGTAVQHCEECGAEMPTNALFCGRCGRRTASESEETENISDAPIEDTPLSPLVSSTAFNNFQDSVSENGEEEEQHMQDSESGNREEEEQQTQDSESENHEEDERQTPPLTSENEEEEQQTQQDYPEPASSMPGELDPGPEMEANQDIDEQPQNDHSSPGTQEAQSPQGSAPRRGARAGSKCLLFFLAGLIVAAGVVAALVGLFHTHLPGMSESSNAQSSSSINETIKSAGSSLTASICIKSSTPTTSGTSNGSGFTLFASSGCSSIIAATANSSCLIFSNNAGASHKYIFDVPNATIGSMSYHLVLGIVGYTGPFTYNDEEHISVGLSEGSTGRNFSWLYRSGNVTINNDEQSGTMDVILESVNGGNTIHVVGDWACGHQIKNT